MVQGYHDERCRQEIAVENDGLWRDKDARRRLVTFGTWLRHYPWPPAGVEDEVPEVGATLAQPGQVAS